ncbi:MAG TPA: SDR family NAD(P)-dependent oxidoreductase [Gemmatimonadaceae bacterium]|nr:SDR family NAD(P)-dependent oxidoreductase [Gemmatimonadaceae bacterium]
MGGEVIDLRGKRALVTGGSRGIGAATALMLAQAGADVCIGYRKRKEAADAVVRRIQVAGRRASAVAGDLAQRGDCDRLIDNARHDLGGLDIFVGNAGTWPSDPVAVDALSDERWLRTVSENVDAMFYTTRAAARTMSNAGRIVLVTSTAGQRGEAFHADYAASKGAMISYVKSLAIELAPRDITVNGVAPGWVDTDMVASAFAAGGREQIAAGIPLGRVATADDIAGPIVFLCTPLARHITGEIVNVNGGSVLCG